jgi:Pyrimidine dimer DNA glycosylase
MRIWTIHPKYLDARGLVALWREALLARSVLRGYTTGYRRHPQLIRFRSEPQPVACLNAYLGAIYQEAARRGYHFDRRKLGRATGQHRMMATSGQVAFEWRHLKRKLRARSPAAYRAVRSESEPDPHPLFVITPGPVSTWERTDEGRRRQVD